ncbi:retinol dehydrogenase 7-like [Acanthaster planci]|uniref:Retinol dehydrogenase 7-like n=1 Tax=Acanthaster planci TaxID=133434 RepID=A0A8B7Z3K7_ACAPL|nr:retinol dehydrogenase 7-like [Acanthaster planci]
MLVLVGAAAAVFACLVLIVLLDRIYLDTSGRYVLITGCDTGFGNLLARNLDKRRGCCVIAACLTEEGRDTLKRVASPRLTTLRLDVTSSESIRDARDAVEALIPEGKGLWGLVNNAGIISPLGPYHWLNREDISKVLQVNLIGAIEVTNMLYPLIRVAGGRIVNVSSAVALFPSSGTIYTASKAGIEAFSDNIRCDMKQSDVSVHIIEPGAFQGTFSDTDAMKRRMDTAWGRLPQAEKDHFGGDIAREAMQLLIVDALRMASPKLHEVTDAMEHALCARFPWRRYLPGLDAKFFYKPMSLLPAFLADRIYSVLFRQALESKKEVVRKAKAISKSD